MAKKRKGTSIYEVYTAGDKYISQFHSLKSARAYIKKNKGVKYQLFKQMRIK